MKFYSFLQHILISILSVVFAENLYSQNYTAEECIKMWGDKKNYHQQAIIDDLFFNYDSLKYQNSIREFDKYGEKHPNDISFQSNLFIYTVYHTIKTSMLSDGILNKENYDVLSEKVQEQIKKVYLTNNNALLAWLYFVTGEIDLMYRNMERALFYNLKALDLLKYLPENAFPNKYNIYHRITQALYYSGDYKEAAMYALQCEKSLANHNKLNSESRVYNCDYLFSIAMRMNDLPLAEKYLHELRKVLDGYKFNSFDKNEIWEGVYYNYKGKLNFAKNNDQEALKDFVQALLLAEKYNDEQNTISLKTSIGDIYLKQNKPDDALNNWLISLSLSKKFLQINKEERRQTTAILRRIAAFYQEKGNFKNALRYYREYEKYKTDLDSETRNASLDAVETSINFDNLINNLENAKLELEHRRLINRIVFIFFIVSLLFIFSFFYINQKRNELQLKIKEDERARLDLELDNAKKYISAFKKSVVEKNNLVSEFSTYLSGKETRNKFNTMAKISILTQEDWETYQAEFTKVYPLFITSLKSDFPTITPALLRISSLFMLDFDTDEIASILGISKKSVQRSILRLRKTLSIETDENIYAWMKTFYEKNQLL